MFSDRSTGRRAILRAMVVATTLQWALFFHLVGAFLLVSGVAVAGVAFEVARRRHDPKEVALLLGLGRAGVVLVGPGSLLTLAFGLWLVHLGHFGFGAGWVGAAFALFIAVGFLGAIGGQRPKRARLVAERLAADDAPESHELRELLDDRLARSLNYLSAALLVAIVVLMVFKPGG